MRSRSRFSAIVCGVLAAGCLLLGCQGAGRDTRTLDLGAGVTMTLVRIEPGTFQMGSPPEEPLRDPDETLHRVTITRPYWLGATEVTQAQWAAVMGSRPWAGREHVIEAPDVAASYISWSDAAAFCRVLAERTNLPVRLPTEAEWAYACRAGTTTPFYFGEDYDRLDAHGWYYENASAAGQKYAHRVAAWPANPWGLYDMHGNLWEWCADWYEPEFTAAPRTDPTGPQTGTTRVQRSGSWDSRVKVCRSADRRHNGPNWRWYINGFRVAVSAEPGG